MASHKTDYEQEGLSRLPAQFQGKPRIEAILGAVLGEIQALEDAHWQLFVERRLDIATGEALDQIGRLVGEPRVGLPDADYRLRIRLRIHRNVSRGEPERLIRVVHELTQSSAVQLEEPSPGVVRITFDGQAIPPELHGAMEDVAAVGVRLHLVNAPVGGFVFSKVSDPSAPASGQGFSDTDQNQGGGLGRVV